MAKNDVNVVMSVQDANVVAAWQRAKQGPEQMAQELEKVNKASRRAGAATGAAAGNATSAFRAAGSELMKMGQAIVGIGSVATVASTAAAMLSRELERIKAMRGEFADQQIESGKAFMQMANALEMKGVKVDPQAIKSQIERGNYGVNLSELYRVSEKALSSAGAMPQEKVIESVTESARLFPYMNEEDRTALVVASNNIQKTFGTTPTQAMSQVVQSAAAAPGAELGDFATYYGGGVSKLAAVGANRDSYQDLMAIMSGIGHRSQDMTGRTTATNTQNALMQLKEEGMKAGMFGKDASVMDMLDAIHGDDAKAKALRGKLLGVFSDAPQQLLLAQKSGNVDLASEAKTKIALMELMQGGDNQTMREIASARGKLGTFPEAEAMTNARREELRAMESQGTYEAFLSRQSASQRMKEDPGIGAAGERVRDVGEMSRNMNDPYTTTKFKEFMAALGASEDPLQSAKQRLADQEAALAAAKDPMSYQGKLSRDVGIGALAFSPPGAAMGLGLSAIAGRRAPTDSDRRNQETLEAKIAETKAMIEALEKNTAVLERIEANTAKGAAPASPKPAKNPASALSAPPVITPWIN